MLVMESKLTLYNTLDRRKETFEPINPPHVGMYVCGPTVYGDPHLGHARPAVTFDLLFRYLRSLGYKVRYVRNVTDVGHLEHDADDGEDKISKKARLEQLEPMEVAHYYTERYHRAMDALNVETPSIEPYASGHIIEQIERPGVNRQIAHRHVLEHQPERLPIGEKRLLVHAEERHDQGGVGEVALRLHRDVSHSGGGRLPHANGPLRQRPHRLRRPGRRRC